MSIHTLARTCALSLAVAAAAARAQAPAARSPLSAADVAGEYELVRIGDQRLPAVVFRVRVRSDHLRLLPDGRYTRTGRTDVCLPDGRCSARAGTARGTWRVTPGGELELRSEREEAAPEAGEADGRQLRFFSYEGSKRVLGAVYERAPAGAAGERGPDPGRQPPNDPLQLSGPAGTPGAPAG